MKKRIVSGILTAAMSIALVSNLSVPVYASAEGSMTEMTNETEITAEMENATEIANEKSESAAETSTRTIVDHLGNEVILPETIETIVTTSITPMPSVYCMFAGSAERLIGMSPSSKAAAENSILADIMPEILEVSTDFMTGGEVNVEELLTMNPDVIFCNASKEDEYNQLRAAGLPVVAVSTSQWGSDSVETFEGWVTLLGEVLGEEDKAAGITEYGREVYNMIQERVSTLDESEKLSVLFLYNYKDGVIRTSGNSHFGQYWADATGTINVAEAQDASSLEINMEQIYEWDPDIIYVSNFVPYLAEDFYNNEGYEGHDWSVVRAVQEGNVYKCPLGVYRWYPPSSDTPLMLLWLAKTNYPELFEDINLEEEMKSYYSEYFGIELNDEDIEKIFHPTREAAGA